MIFSAIALAISLTDAASSAAKKLWSPVLVSLNCG